MHREYYSDFLHDYRFIDRIPGYSFIFSFLCYFICYLLSSALTFVGLCFSYFQCLLDCLCSFLYRGACEEGAYELETFEKLFVNVLNMNVNHTPDNICFNNLYGAFLYNVLTYWNICQLQNIKRRKKNTWYWSLLTQSYKI